MLLIFPLRARHAHTGPTRRRRRRRCRRHRHAGRRNDAACMRKRSGGGRCLRDGASYEIRNAANNAHETRTEAAVAAAILLTILIVFVYSVVPSFCDFRFRKFSTARTSALCFCTRALLHIHTTEELTLSVYVSYNYFVCISSTLTSFEQSTTPELRF